MHVTLHPDLGAVIFIFITNNLVLSLLGVVESYLELFLSPGVGRLLEALCPHLGMHSSLCSHVIVRRLLLEHLVQLVWGVWREKYIIAAKLSSNTAALVRSKE